MVCSLNQPQLIIFIIRIKRMDSLLRKRGVGDENMQKILILDQNLDKDCHPLIIKTKLFFSFIHVRTLIVETLCCDRSQKKVCFDQGWGRDGTVKDYKRLSQIRDEAG
jgi:hypothetical protein